MPISALDAAYRAMREAYRYKESCGRRLTALEKKFRTLSQKVFGALPGDPEAAEDFATQANVAEGEVKKADATYVKAQKAYDKALADFVRVALQAGLDR